MQLENPAPRRTRPNMPLAPPSLTRDQRRAFLRDGFVVIRNAVPLDMVATARELILAEMPASERRILAPAKLATHPDVIRLFRQTRLADVMRNEMGPFPEVVSCQIAMTPGHDKLGGTPRPHVDGSWSGPIPTRAEEIDPEKGRPRDAARYFGDNDDRLGANDGQLWQDPDRTISLGSYTALVGVALNDQLEPDNGQFGVLKGMHEEVQAAFRRQREAGSVIGPEGLDWPRIKIGQDGRPFLNGLPEKVRAKAEEAGRRANANDGWPWPEITPVLLGPGDAVIALHSCPHTATPNLGPDPRMNIYFRIRRWREGNPHEGTRRVGHGVSDHPDRGYYGQFLDYPPTYDPWKTSVDKLCGHWSEWNGMLELVRASLSR